MYLQYVKKQTEELCMLAVQQNSDALFFVRELTPKLCEMAVQKNRFTLHYVKEQMKNYVNGYQQYVMCLLYVK